MTQDRRGPMAPTVRRARRNAGAAGRIVAIVLIVGVVAGAGAGCAQQGDERGEPGATEIAAPGVEESLVQWDSAGVSMSRSAKALWELEPTSAWTIAAAPTAEIGGRDDTVSAKVTGVVGARRLGDGRIVVAAAGGLILWFSESGEMLFERGGMGEGPGEIRSGGIRRLVVVPPDSVAALHRAGRLVAIFDGTGAFVTELWLDPVPPGVAPAGRFGRGGLLRLWDGRWIASIVPPDPPSFAVDMVDPDFYRMGRALLAISADGRHVDTLGYFPGPLASTDPSRRRPGYPNNAELVFSAMDQEIFVGDGWDHVVNVYRDGVLRRRIFWDGDDLAIPEEDYPAWREHSRTIGGLRAANDSILRAMQARLDSIVAALEIAHRRAAYTALLSDGSGNIWVRLNRPDPQFETYTVIRGDGQVLGDVTMPEGLEVTDVGSDFVLGLTTDFLGVEAVHLYGIVKP